MPTYRNVTQNNIRIKGRWSEDFISPDKTLETDAYYDVEGLELVDDLPIYTPLLSEETVVGNANQEVNVSISLTSEFILFNIISGKVEIHNVMKGFKVVTLSSGEMFGWDVKKRSRQIVCVFKEAGTLIVSQFSEKCELG